MEPLLLVSLGFGAHLLEELEDFSGLVLVQRVSKLVNRRGDLEPLVENLLLSLKANVPGPLDVPSEVTAGRKNILAEAKDAFAGRKERIRLGLARRVRLLRGRLGLGFLRLGHLGLNEFELNSGTLRVYKYICDRLS